MPTKIQTVPPKPNYKATHHALGLLEFDARGARETESEAEIALFTGMKGFEIVTEAPKPTKADKAAAEKAAREAEAKAKAEQEAKEAADKAAAEAKAKAEQEAKEAADKAAAEKASK